MLKSLLKWPPQPTTVIGLGVIIGTGVFFATGNAPLAFLVSGLVKVLVPDNSDAAAQQVQSGIQTLAKALGRPIGLVAAFAVLAGIGSALSGCAESGTSTIQTGCAEYQKGKAAADAVVATGVVPGNIAVKIASIESFGDAACAHPPAGNPLSTAIWFGGLAGQIVALTSGSQGGA